MRENTDAVYKYIAETFYADDNLDYIRDEMEKINKLGMSISIAEAGILQFFIKTFAVKNIVEIGTFLGYSAIKMAEALPVDGKLTSFELNPDYYQLAKKHVEQAGLAPKIEIILGDAKSILDNLSGPYDMVFIDANKSAYLDYLDWADKYIKKGGLIVGDNTLLFGSVLENTKPKGESQARWHAMRSFNQRLADQERYISMMLPTQQGLTIAVKK